uniref:AlNc14C145G7355 protein n=1 Tax=Albugo laibachii Nc14 TaxID=890382 RepID=F0WLG8_9STRA|nr:AlNc14C145G7355 [Albugo laibachii Nc14]|eukprot:CCA22131.1 AlNc14C145G7355 [Albugo laibachii Nc14]
MQGKKCPYHSRAGKCTSKQNSFLMRIIPCSYFQPRMMIHFNECASLSECFREVRMLQELNGLMSAKMMKIIFSRTK